MSQSELDKIGNFQLVEQGLKGKATGARNGKWKGDDVGRVALHEWVRSHKPNPGFCEICKQIPPIKKDGKDGLDVANKSGNYLRDVDDWQYLCRKCHMRGHLLGIAHSKEHKERISEGLKDWWDRRRDFVDSRMIALLATKRRKRYDVDVDVEKEQRYIERAKTTKCRCKHWTETSPCFYRTCRHFPDNHFGLTKPSDWFTGEDE